MRQRRIKNLEERIENLKDHSISEPEAFRGKWDAYFAKKGRGGKPIFLEIGSGKGQFITQMGKENPHCNFIAVEVQPSVWVLAVEKALKEEVDNVIFLNFHMKDVTQLFEKGELDGIYLNFSDPWHKARHAKRRLTHRNFLKKYFEVLKEDGFVQMKTDDDNLFEFTLEEIDDLRKSENMKILEEEVTRNLHGSKYAEGNVMTEYELNARAKEMIKKHGRDRVINGTIGALLDDEGELAVITSVIDEMNKLRDKDFAEYAPIGGISEFKDAIVKAVHGNNPVELFTEVVATPGGTGGIRNTVANYTKIGDKVLTSDWHWAPYKTICEEQGRSLVTYRLFNDEGSFNFADFEEQFSKLCKEQENVVIMLNTPAHNPTGYEISLTEWQRLIEILNDEKYKENRIILFIDVAYIDFAGEPDKVRNFIPMLKQFDDNVLSLIGYSASKTFTLYGLRTGAVMCMAQEKAVAEEFRRVFEFSSRNTWSNCVRSGQQLIANIYNSDEALKKVEEERADFRNMLLARGRAFEEAAKISNLKTVPFVSGFFICVECDDSVKVSELLTEYGIFAVPLAKGIRISIASINEKQCKRVVEVLKEIGF